MILSTGDWKIPVILGDKNKLFLEGTLKMEGFLLIFYIRRTAWQRQKDT